MRQKSSTVVIVFITFIDDSYVGGGSLCGVCVFSSSVDVDVTGTVTLLLLLSSCLLLSELSNGDSLFVSVDDCCCCCFDVGVFGLVWLLPPRRL